MAKLRVIIPVFNTEKYLDRCINSVLNQSFRDLEVVLIDDGSTDSSPKKCDHYSNVDKRVRVIHTKNKGTGAARNEGLKSLDTTYVSFVDSDDYIEIDTYEQLIREIEKNRADIGICGRYDVFDGYIKKRFNLKDIKIWNRKTAIRNLALSEGLDSSVCDKVFKSNLFRKIKFPEKEYNEDMFVTIKILNQCKKITHIGSCKYYYHHITTSKTSGKYLSNKINLIKATEFIFNFIKKNYPDLQKEGEKLYFENLIHVWNYMEQKKEDKIRDKVKKKIKIFNLLINKHIKWGTKINSLLLITNQYLFFKNRILTK